MGRMRSVLSRPAGVAVVVAVVVAAVVGLYWFQPWKIWQDETVQEALPGASAGAAPSGGAAESPSAAPSGPSASPSTPAGPANLAAGELISHEHETSGTVRLLRLPDGSHTVRLENLDTSNGPDLRVWLTDAPVKEGRAGWHVFDDGAYVSLGKLKGNKGDQNYALPADIDPARYSSVTIWCDRFDVSFGAAELSRA
ncbi:DM13 domain-containing protein [Streptomyces sp. Tu 2975]|uniref:DM13 domain-containing protein n=1 Tax=Streptomyces sp. Tu 2975 TaxID=2676871 RepID=UPI00135BB98F|nr:DM13 domain-containing protein [Streptomyces sp. Tu 2975]QIP85269.1 DM13 domain-containing protein [Streptomyces sp. Tu 2975]